jgi:hypothetical protein
MAVHDGLFRIFNSLHINFCAHFAIEREILSLFRSQLPIIVIREDTASQPGQRE